MSEITDIWHEIEDWYAERGNGFFVDTAPSPAGTVGQVRYNELNSGKYHDYRNDEYDFEGICDQDTIDDFEDDSEEE